MADTSILELEDYKTLIGPKGVGDADDERFQLLIDQAIQWFEEKTDRIIFTKPVIEDIDGNGLREIYLKYNPVVTLTKVELSDSFNDDPAIDITSDVILYEDIGKIAIKFISDTHSIFINGQKNVHIEYDPGWAVDDLPKNIQLAIARMVETAFRRLDKQNAFSSKSFQGGSVVFVANDINDFVKDVVNRYKRKSHPRM